MRSRAAVGIGITAGQHNLALLSGTTKVVAIRGGMVWAGGAPGSYRRRRLGIESPFACSVRISDRASCVNESVGSKRRGRVRTVILHGGDYDGRSGRRIDSIRAPGAAWFTRSRPGCARLWVHGGIRSRRRHDSACGSCSCCVASGGGGRSVSRRRSDVICIVGI